MFTHRPSLVMLLPKSHHQRADSIPTAPRQRRTYLLVLSGATFVLLMLQLACRVQDVALSPLQLLPTSFPHRTHTRACPDPYSLPGYLLHDHEARTARWIPYSDAILDSIGDATLPETRNQLSIPADILKEAPPSYTAMLTDLNTRTKEPQLDFLRDKTIILLGCSLDRYFLQFFCWNYGGTLNNPLGEWHGMFTCDIPDVGLHVQLWFTYGAGPEAGDPSDIYDGLGLGVKNFEERIQNYWIPEVEKAGMTRKPDLIIWASGIWDVLGLRKRYALQTETWKEQAVSWQELAWHRTRLTQMATFIKSEWPDTPAMYRPPSYLLKGDVPQSNWFLQGVKTEDVDYINEAVFRLGQSAQAVLAKQDVPIFRWAEKLIGNTEYSDPIHLDPAGSAQALYAEMMLYYLRYYTAGKGAHCAP